MKHTNARGFGAILCVLITVSAVPAYGCTTPWMHAPEYDGGWGLLDSSTWSDPNELEQPTALTGDWGGLRRTLRHAGIDFTGLYMMESAGNPTGGDLHKLRYTHDLGLAIYLDLDKLLGLKHTYFLVSASQRVGNNLSGDIPNFFQVQQEYGHPTLRLDNLAIEEQLLNGRLDIVAGRIKTTDDFAYSSVSCYSQNLGLCDFRMGMPYNASIPSHPYSAWGTRVRYDLTPDFYSMTGAYNTYAGFRSIQWHGADFSIRHNSGVALFQEFAYSSQSLRIKDYPATFKLGGFYDSEPLRQFVSNRITGTWMVYGLAEQRLFDPEPVSDPELGTPRGLTGLVGFAYAPPDVDTIEYFANAGLLYNGPLPQRSQDALGLFAIFGKFSSDLREAEQIKDQAAMTNETVLELNYMYNATQWLHVQPDVQGVIRPDGTGLVNDALVFGLQVGINL
jgi:porin